MSDLNFIDSNSGQPASRRARDLNRMRLAALGLLIVMSVVFAVTSALAAWLPFLLYPRAFAEAAMVGAFADWFAVVALFRHPLGIPIPHTAIVPRHKQQIGEALGQFISTNFLAPDEVSAKLEKIDTARWLSRWLKEPENVTLVACRLHGVLPPLLEFLREEQLRQFSRGVIRNGIDSIAAAPLAGRILSVLVDHGHHDALFDVAIESAKTFIIDNREAFRQKVAKNSIYWLPTWVDAKLADVFLAALLDTFAGAHAPNSQLRLQYRAFLNRLITRLAKDPVIFDQAERLKADVLDNSVIDSYLVWLSGEIEEKIKNEAATSNGLFSSGLEHALLAFGEWLESDEHIREMINRWARQIVLTAIEPNRAEIGTFVAEVVTKWDTTTLVEKLELQVGRDLQFIRINGTIVGGLVGLTIFTVTKAFG